MAELTGPNLGLKYGWAIAEDGWAEGMNANLKYLDVVVQGAFIDFVDDLPLTASHGDVYIKNSDKSVYVWRGSSFQNYGKKAGWTLYSQEDGLHYTYDGADWNETFVVGGELIGGTSDEEGKFPIANEYGRIDNSWLKNDNVFESAISDAAHASALTDRGATPAREGLAYWDSVADSLKIHDGAKYIHGAKLPSYATDAAASTALSPGSSDQGKFQFLNTTREQEKWWSGQMWYSRRSNQFVATQASHGFTIGKLVRYNGTAWVLSNPTSYNQTRTHVVVKVIDTNNFVVQDYGFVEIPGHGFASGVYFDNPSTPGSPTASTAYGSAYFYAPSFYVVDSNTLFINTNNGGSFTGAPQTTYSETAYYVMQSVKTVATGTPLILDFETARVAHAAVTTGASWQYITPSAGWYEINCGIKCSKAVAANQQLIMQLTLQTQTTQLNDATDIVNYINGGASSTNTHGLKFTKIVSMGASKLIRANFSGTNANAGTFSIGYTGDDCYIQIRKVVI